MHSLAPDGSMLVLFMSLFALDGEQEANRYSNTEKRQSELVNFEFFSPICLEVFFLQSQQFSLFWGNSN